VDGFPCSMCGACCRQWGNVPADLREGVVPDTNGVCPHLTADNRCSIYATRPAVCRVEESCPLGMDMSLWFFRNLVRCDELHRLVYGSERVPLSR